MTTIDLKFVTFDNDFFTLSLEDGTLLVLNSVDEDFNVEHKTLAVKRVNIEIVSYDDNGNEIHTPCTNIIGLKDSHVNIKTKYNELLSSALNIDNMYYCSIEV